MVGLKTRLLVADNSGAKLVECFNILGSFSHFARIGSILVVAVKKAVTKKKVKEHDVRYALVIRTRRRFRRANGIFFSFCSNTVVILDSKKNPFFTRIKGIVPIEFRRSKYLKIISLSEGVF